MKKKKEENDEILDAEIIEQEETELSKLGQDFHSLIESDENQSQLMSLMPFLMKSKDAKSVAEIAHKKLSPALLVAVLSTMQKGKVFLEEFLSASEEINSFDNLAKQLEESAE